jgi:hypothetical protein
MTLWFYQPEVAHRSLLIWPSWRVPEQRILLRFGRTGVRPAWSGDPEPLAGFADCLSLSGLEAHRPRPATVLDSLAGLCKQTLSLEPPGGISTME